VSEETEYKMSDEDFNDEDNYENIEKEDEKMDEEIEEELEKVGDEEEKGRGGEDEEMEEEEGEKENEVVKEVEMTRLFRLDSENVFNSSEREALRTLDLGEVGDSRRI
jgi:hypothetical protein